MWQSEHAAPAHGVPGVVETILRADKPYTRSRLTFVAAKLVTDPHRLPHNHLYLGVSRPDGHTEWLSTQRYRDLLTEAEAREWVGANFAEAANDAAQ